jgi:hypothetical protein
MSRSRVVSGALAVLLLLCGIGSALANVPPPVFPDGNPPVPIPEPAPKPDPLIPKPGPDVIPSVEPPPPPPKKAEPRRGLFRSCGSGAPTGLVGIGVGWAMLWVGTRLVSRRTRSAK